jgi:hypothetical protein
VVQIALARAETAAFRPPTSAERSELRSSVRDALIEVRDAITRQKASML